MNRTESGSGHSKMSTATYANSEPNETSFGFQLLTGGVNFCEAGRTQSVTRRVTYPQGDAFKIDICFILKFYSFRNAKQVQGYW